MSLFFNPIKKLSDLTGDVGRFFGGAADAVLPGDQSSWHRPAPQAPQVQPRPQPSNPIDSFQQYTNDKLHEALNAPIPGIGVSAADVGVQLPGAWGRTAGNLVKGSADVATGIAKLPTWLESQQAGDAHRRALDMNNQDTAAGINELLGNVGVQTNDNAFVDKATRFIPSGIGMVASGGVGAAAGTATEGAVVASQTAAKLDQLRKIAEVSPTLAKTLAPTVFAGKAVSATDRAMQLAGKITAESAGFSGVDTLLTGKDPRTLPEQIATNAAFDVGGRVVAKGAKDAWKATHEGANVIPKGLDTPLPGRGRPEVNLPNGEPFQGVEHGGVVQTLKKGFSDADQVILDELRNIDKHYPVTEGPSRVDQFMFNSNMQRGSNAVANNAMNHSANLNTALSGLNETGYQDFSNYANARTELSMAKDGLKTSKSKGELQAIVDAGGSHDERFQALNNHFKDVADVAHKAGLISDETHALYKKNNDYVRIQRDMGELLPPPGKGNGYQNGSTIMSQTRKGSKKAVLDVGETAAHYTQQIYKEAAKNRTGTNLMDNLHAAGLANKLIDASTVTARRETYKKLAETKPIRDQLGKAVKKASAELKDLTKKNAEHGQKTLDRIMSNEQNVRKVAIKHANGEAHLPGRTKKPAVMPTEAHMTQAFEEYIHGDPATFNALGKFFNNRKKMTQMASELDGLKSQFDKVKSERKDLFTDTLHMRDGSTKNKNTVSILRNGVKETYEVGPEMKEAINNISPYQMNAVMQILAVPGRVLRAGVTGLNPIFITRNLLKDQVGSAINSDHLLATHNPKVFTEGLVRSLRDALPGGSHDALYQDFLSHYGDTTSYDLTRNVKDTTKMVARLRGGKAEAAKQAILSPIRSLENVAAFTEKSTRFQNYAGEYRKAISEGLPKDQASERAAMAAWQNSVDFSRAGTWGRALNTVLPYWNPATQGVRQMGRALVKHPAKTMFTATATIGVPLATATAWNLSTPENAAIYNNISEFEKENNLILIPPGTTQNEDGSYDLIKFPLAPGWKDIFMPTRRAMESFHAGEPQKFGAMAADVLQAMTGPVSLQSPGALMGSLTPQAIKPAVQQYTNTDLFTGKSIVPDYMQSATDASGNPVPENKKAYKTSSGTAQAIGDLTHTSPIRIEKGIKDVAGTVGLMGLNFVDARAADLGLIPKDKVGGVSLSSGLKRSFGEAASDYNFNKSDGAKHFDDVKAASAILNPVEQKAYDALHPTTKNFLGDTMVEIDSTYNPAERLATYNRYPKVFEVDKKVDALNRAKGQPGNPMFDLSPDQVKKVLEKDNLPPGAKDPELSQLYAQDWYADYSTNKSKFYTAIKDNQKTQLAAAEAKGDTKAITALKTSMAKFDSPSNPYPVTPPDVQKAMDFYSSLPKGTGARKAWIQGNAGVYASMQDQFAKIDSWQNIQRGKRGLAATEGAEGKANGYGTVSTSFGSGSSDPLGAAGGGSTKYAVSRTAGGAPRKASVSIKASSAPKAKAKVKVASSSGARVSIKKSRV